LKAIKEHPKMRSPRSDITNHLTYDDHSEENSYRLTGNTHSASVSIKFNYLYRQQLALHLLIKGCLRSKTDAINRATVNLNRGGVAIYRPADPRRLRNPQYEEALAALRDGIEARKVNPCTGEAGTGKSL
jgi:hypothetical protein